MSTTAKGLRVEFLVPTLPGSALSPNGNKGSWPAKMKATRQLREDTYNSVLRSLESDFRPEKARVGVEYRITSKRPRDGCYRPRDVMNAVAALKPLYDGLVDAGVLPDDSAEHMELGEHRIVKVEAYQDEGLYVTVEEL